MTVRSVACFGFTLALMMPDCAFATDNQPPVGFTALFSGKDLAGWHGGTTEDPRRIASQTDQERQTKRIQSLQDVTQHWNVQDPELVNDGHGLFLTTNQDFENYELWIDYKTVAQADSGVYLKGTPQIQIWDSTNTAAFKHGSDKGSGGLWNNRPGTPGKDPLVHADKPFGEWNRFHIVQIGARTTVHLNDKLVVDHAILENYFDNDRVIPLVRKGPIQLQTHGAEIRWKNIFIREILNDEATRLLSRNPAGLTSLFNGQDLSGWAGNLNSYEVANGAIRCRKGQAGVLYTKEAYADFTVHFEFKLPAGGNNGLAIRYPGEGDPAYTGMCELQILDTESPQYASIDPRQTHGSAYGMAAAARGYLRPVGEWNYQQVTVIGSQVTVELNGTPLLDTDLSKITDYLENKPHPGKTRTTGFFGFAGHGDAVEFRNILIKPQAQE
jgi:hypothetical protein